MQVQFPSGTRGDLVRLDIGGEHVSLIRGERLDVVLKARGSERVVPEDAAAVENAIFEMTGRRPS